MATKTTDKKQNTTKTSTELSMDSNPPAEATVIDTWFENELQRDIWEKKYCVNGESLDEFFDRISGGNQEMRALIKKRQFMPGGRILASRGLGNMGRKITYSNCYVIAPPEDNIESIFDCAARLARTYSYGGGCGVDISKLSPAGARINNAAKATTGSISFMDLYSLVTELIGQSGRRGALMISLDCSHPDLMNFIDIKSDLQKVTKANISIKISDDFMNAAIKNEDWTLHYTREVTGEVIKKVVNAGKVLSKIAYNNWDMAEPGALFWDKIKNWNLLSEDDNFEYSGVNPCAEEPLPAGGSCLLGSINLSEFVKNPMTGQAEFDLEEFAEVVKVSVKFLNEILDEGLPLHPLEEQRESVGNWRQIGLGIMGLGDALIKLGIRYGSPEAVEICDRIGFTMADTAICASAELAAVEGAYPTYDKEAVFSSPYFLVNTTEKTRRIVEKHGLRNSQLLTIAPTGSISTMLGISGGVEPIYNISYTRKTESLHGEDRYYKVFTPIVAEYMKVHDIEEEDDLPEFFSTAMTLEYDERIRMQAAWQRHIDASISSTVNVPEDFTLDDVRNLYVYAWQNGLKGVTIYRDNCRRTGILTNSGPGGTAATFEFDQISPIGRGNLGKTYGTTSKYKTACGSLFITINRNADGHIVESFVNTSKSGICKSNVDGMSRLISLALRSGVKVSEVIDQLSHINCAACVRTQARGDKLDGMSCPDIIARAIADDYKSLATVNVDNKFTDAKAKRAKSESNKTSVPTLFDVSNAKMCPDCGEKLQHEGGCVICKQCGWSKCS